MPVPLERLNMTGECERCPFEEKAFVLPDGFTYRCHRCPVCGRTEYSIGEAQKLIDYSKAHIFMHVEDWIVAWLAVRIHGRYVPMWGIEDLQEQMYLVTVFFAPGQRIPTEDAGFRNIGYVPYSPRVDRALETLRDLGYVRSGGIELTASGKKRGEALLSRFDDVTRKNIENLRMDLRGRTPDV